MVELLGGHCNVVIHFDLVEAHENFVTANLGSS